MWLWPIYFSGSDYIPSIYQENIRVSFVAYTAALRFIEGIFLVMLAYIRL